MVERAKRIPLKPETDAVLVIDVLNDLEFAGGEKVLPWARRLVEPLRTACPKARRAGIPVVYANDNFGLWRGSRDDVIAHCTRPGVRGGDVSRRLKPSSRDYFILKPRHSAFFATPFLNTWAPSGSSSRAWRQTSAC